jgi:hypothetical protein
MYGVRSCWRSELDNQRLSTTERSGGFSVVVFIMRNSLVEGLIGTRSYIYSQFGSRMSADISFLECAVFDK